MHAVRTASHDMEGFVGFCTVERCYQPMVVFLSPEVEITDLTVVHTCTRGPAACPACCWSPTVAAGATQPEGYAAQGVLVTVIAPIAPNENNMHGAVGRTRCE